MLDERSNGDAVLLLRASGDGVNDVLGAGIFKNGSDSPKNTIGRVVVFGVCWGGVFIVGCPTASGFRLSD